MRLWSITCSSAVDTVKSHWIKSTLTAPEYQSKPSVTAKPVSVGCEPVPVQTRHGLGSRAAGARLKNLSQIRPILDHPRGGHDNYLSLCQHASHRDSTNNVRSARNCLAYALNDTGRAARQTSANCSKWRPNCSPKVIQTSQPTHLNSVSQNLSAMFRFSPSAASKASQKKGPNFFSRSRASRTCDHTFNIFDQTF